MDALYRGDELNSSIGRPSDYGFSHYRGDYGGDWRAATWRCDDCGAMK